MNRAISAHEVQTDSEGPDPAARARSSLKERQVQLTRSLILEATSAAIRDDPMLEFSMQQVAQRAGIALRSLYRHFPNRRALFEAQYDWVYEQLGIASLLEELDSVEQLPTMAAELFARFSEAPGRPAAIASAALPLRPLKRAEAEQRARQVFAKDLAGLEPSQLDRAFAVIRQLISSHTWFALTEQAGLNAASAQQAVEWAVKALIRDLKQDAVRE